MPDWGFSRFALKNGHTVLTTQHRRCIPTALTSSATSSPEPMAGPAEGNRGNGGKIS